MITNLNQPATAYEAVSTSKGNTIYAIHADATSRPIRNLMRHSQDGFNWGYDGSGPADTARSILADLTNTREVDVATYRAFSAQVIANQDEEGFTLKADSIRTWLEDFEAGQ